MNKEINKTKLMLSYMIIAFLFSILIRTIWVYQFDGYEPFMFNGQFMINTNDGYYWAEGARDILANLSSVNLSSPVNSALSNLTAFFVFILPFSFESIIFYMPAFLSSLVVIPIMLIAKDLKNLEFGFIAALISSIAWSYYNRTMVGYYDTDMLNIVLPMFLLWSIMGAIQTNKYIYLLIGAVDIIIYRWWYPQSYSLELAFFGLIAFYTIIFDKKNIYNYKLLSIIMLAMMMSDEYLRLILVSIAFYIFRQEKYNKYVYYILGISIILFFSTGGFAPVIDKLQSYVFINEINTTKEGMGLHFYSVMQTIKEAKNIPFEIFANRISGHQVTFFISIIGFLYLSYKHKIMLFSLPLLGLGLMASVGGLRFTIYAVPILAFGISFIIVSISKQIERKIVSISKQTEREIVKIVKIAFMFMATSLVLIPHIVHIAGHNVPSVFTNNEVKILDNLKNISDPDDYVISWWDYGYPIRYYSNTKTLIDGGLHSGAVNFPVSFMMTNPQNVSAKLARLDVEYQTMRKNKNNKKSNLSNIEQMSLDYGHQDTNSFLLSLKKDINLPKKTSDIYFYMPRKMLNIYNVVNKFSNIDLMSGKIFNNFKLIVKRRFDIDGAKIVFEENFWIDQKNKTLQILNKKSKIKRIVTTKYLDGNISANVRIFDYFADINIIYISSINVFLIIDEKTYNSTYIQMSILGFYDEKYFEKIISNPLASIYKLKI